MNAGSRQLGLPLEISTSYGAEDFYETAGNQLAMDMLSKPHLWSHNRLILWGDSGGGKTHLLHIWADLNGATLVDAAALRELPAAMNAPIAIDDSDLASDEAIFLHVLNAASEAGQPVLLAARLPPARRKIALPDLASRLRSSAVVEITPPTDTERAALLSRLAAQRQLILPLQVQNYLLTRLARTPAALIDAVTRLDKIALANGGKITRQLAAAFINDIADEDRPGSEMLSNGHSRATSKLL